MIIAEDRLLQVLLCRVLILLVPVIKRIDSLIMIAPVLHIHGFTLIPSVLLWLQCRLLVLQLLPVFLFYNDTPTPQIYTLSLHDALQILLCRVLILLVPVIKR